MKKRATLLAIVFSFTVLPAVSALDANDPGPLRPMKSGHAGALKAGVSQAIDGKLGLDGTGAGVFLARTGTGASECAVRGAARELPIDEVEPNDSLGNGQELGDIVSGDPWVISGTIDPIDDDEDCFVFDIPVLGCLDVRLEWSDCYGTDEDVKLYRKRFLTWDLEASSLYDCPETISGVTLAEDLWGVKVSAPAGTSGDSSSCVTRRTSSAVVIP